MRVREEEMSFLKGGASTDIIDSGDLLRNDSFEISDDGSFLLDSVDENRLNFGSDDSPAAIQSAFTPSTETRHARFSVSPDSEQSDRSERNSSARHTRGDRIHTPATTLGGTFDSEEDFPEGQSDSRGFDLDSRDEEDVLGADESDDGDF